MPRLKVNESEEKDRITRAYIAKNMELYNMTDEDVAVKLRCTKKTFRNKKKRPETFTLGELRRLCNAIKLTDEEKALIM